MRRFLRFGIALVMACASTDPVVPGDQHQPTRIQLSMSTLSLTVGQRDTARARVYDAMNRVVTEAVVRWDSDDPSVAAVDGFGEITGIAPGRTRVVASTGGLSSSITVEVRKIALVELDGPRTMYVNQSVPLAVIARDSTGLLISNFPLPVFSISDSSVLAVNGSGTVRGTRRGNASVTVRIAGMTASIDLHVRAQLRLSPSFPVLGMQVSDTLRLFSMYADVNGAPIPEAPRVSWSSNNSPSVMVSIDGRVTATAAALARISAMAEEDTTFADVYVNDFRPGQATSVRYVHAVKGNGPITFLPDGGAPVTLSYGETVERPVLPGTYHIGTQGLPGNDSRLTQFVPQVNDGDRVSIVAVSVGPTQGMLAGVWSRALALPANWGVVRLLQGSGFSTYFIRGRGKPATGLPEDCYLDPGDVHGGGSYPSGAYDVIVTTKFGLHWPGIPTEVARVPFEIPSGRGITLVLMGTSAADASVLTVPDP